MVRNYVKITVKTQVKNYGNIGCKNHGKKVVKNGSIYDSKNCGKMVVKNTLKTGVQNYGENGSEMVKVMVNIEHKQLYLKM